MISKQKARTLEVTCGIILITRESSLGFLFLKLIEDLAVRDIADLVVLLDELALLEANATFSHTVLVLGHHSVTRLIGGAYIAVDAFPAIFTLTSLIPTSGSSVASVGQRAT